MITQPQLFIVCLQHADKYSAKQNHPIPLLFQCYLLSAWDSLLVSTFPSAIRVPTSEDFNKYTSTKCKGLQYCTYHSDGVFIASLPAVDKLHSPILDVAFTVVPSTKHLRSESRETDSETEIYMQEIHWGVVLGTILVRKWKKQVWAEKEGELQQLHQKHQPALWGTLLWNGPSK